MYRKLRWIAAAGAACAALTLPRISSAQGGSFVNFETIPTRGVSLSPDGSRLFVTNTPDARLEIFDVTPTGLTPAGSVPVGLDPIAVNARTNGEVWVVNHLSDSVSVVDVSSPTPHVVRTLLVGDEPRDVVFAGPASDQRAFISAARRGQNHPDDTIAETQMPSIGRADIWVFDADSPGTSLGGNPMTIVTLFSDKPGSMTVSPDGAQVFVSIFTSGNNTTSINDAAVCTTNNTVPSGGTGGSINSFQDNGPCVLDNGGNGPGGVPGPNVNQGDGAPNPRTGIITKFQPQTGAWLDVLGRDWRDAVQSSLADNDVFVLDALANPPVAIQSFQGVGTLNFNLVSHPTNGKTYLTTIQAINTNRFISVPPGVLDIAPNGLLPNPGGTLDGVGGPTVTADPITGKTLRGHLYESNVAVLDPSGSVTVRHLNNHIDYENPFPDSTVKARSVAQPQGVAFSADGSTLFIAAFGSNQIVPFATADIDNGTIVPDASTHIQLSGDGGPTDMVISGNRMFVYKRFDNSIAEVNLDTRTEVSDTPLFNPEPDAVRVGRKFFYDATLTSENGEANCSVCHPSADKDDLAWNLGSPFSGLVPNPNPFVPPPLLSLFQPAPQANQTANGIVGGDTPTVEFNPLKGPMTVLTLRGIKDSGPMFWRGDMTNATDPTDERANFKQFNVVFAALNGMNGVLSESDLDDFANWALSIVPPPNPHRNLDNSLTATQASGQNIFLGGEGNTEIIFQCQTCHGLDRGQGFFGTRGENVVEGETQFFKVTQLRTVYDKIGMFGHNFGDNGDARTLGGPRPFTGPQVKGFGTLHDGSAAGPEEFLTAPVFTLDQRQLFEVVDFTFAFDSNLAPVVGQQVTLASDSGSDIQARVDLLEQRAGASFVLPGPLQTTECDLVAKAAVDGLLQGFLFDPSSGNYRTDTGTMISSADLRALANTPGQEVTFTAVYPGGGVRLGLDRDEDGILDNANAPVPDGNNNNNDNGNNNGGNQQLDPITALVLGILGAIFGGFGQ